MNAPIIRPATDSGKYSIESESRPGVTYTVDLNAGTCTCPHHLYRRQTCKHIRLANEYHWELEAERQAAQARLSINELKWRLMGALVAGTITRKGRLVLDGCARIQERRQAALVAEVA